MRVLELNFSSLIEVSIIVLSAILKHPVVVVIQEHILIPIQVVVLGIQVSLKEVIIWELVRAIDFVAVVGLFDLLDLIEKIYATSSHEIVVVVILILL